MVERRNEQRQFTCIPAGFEEEGSTREHFALVHDLSPRGATLFTQQQLEAGADLELGLHIDPDPNVARPAKARVVHCERRPWDKSDLWTWQAGIEFQESIAPYQPAIEALTERQRAAGLDIP